MGRWIASLALAFCAAILSPSSTLAAGSSPPAAAPVAISVKKTENGWLDYLMMGATVLAAVAACGGAFATYSAARAAQASVDDGRAAQRQAAHLAAQAALSTQLQVYIAAYTKGIEETGSTAFTLTEYRKRGAAYDKRRFRANIAAAMLLETAQRMHDAGDPRAERWAAYLAGIPGPLLEPDFMEGYVSDDWGREKLRIAREEARKLNPETARMDSSAPGVAP